MSSENGSQQVYNDEDEIRKIKIIKLRDEFLINRIFKYALLVFYLIMITTVTIFLILQLFTNFDFRNKILEIISTNLPGIIVSGLSILGIYRATTGNTDKQ